MRKLKRGDEGIALVLTTIAMAALLACASLAIDIGKTAVSTREVQNSADAAALAAANDCARSGQIQRNLAQYGNGSTATCDMAASTAIGNASNTVDRLFGMLTIPTQRSATAKWGTLASYTDVFPLTIGKCAIDVLTPGQTVTLHAHNFGGCNNGPGQFGWLEISCSSPTTVDTSAGLDGTNGNTPKSCTDSQLDAFMGTDILVPVFDPNPTIPCGHTYCISSFAQFHLTGWSGNGASSYGCDNTRHHMCPGSTPPSTLAKQCDDSIDGVLNPTIENTPCIRGYFIKPVRVENVGQVQPGTCDTAALYICRVYLSN